MTGTATLAPAQRAALEARAGADLFAYRTADDPAQITKHLRKLTADEGPGLAMLEDVDVLKTGVFNGWVFTDGDLAAMVDHFSALRDGGVFLPPMRLDHTWTIRDVVGYFEGLRVASAEDPTDGLVKAYLRADIRITEQIALEGLKRGTFRNRSSEVGAYETNAGALYPLIFYGAAWVDIPAVEGLRPIELGRPRSVSVFGNPERTPAVPPTTDPATDPAATDPAATTDPAASGDPAATDPAATDPAASGGSTTPETGGSTATDAPTGSETEAELRAELTRLRDERRDADVERFEQAGAVVKANREHAVTLLGHTDAGVRDAARALLASVPSRVGTLGKGAGSQASATAAGSGESTGDTIELDMDSADVGRIWGSYTTEQRKPGTPEHKAYEAWRAARRS